MLNVTQQRLVDQRNNILKRKWLSDLKMKEIQRNIEISDIVKWGWKEMKMRDGSWNLIMKGKMCL